MRRAAPPKPHKRNGYWHLVRRVPVAFQAHDKRGIVFMSTDIAIADDPRATRAREVVAKLDRDLHAYWNALAAGDGAEAHGRFIEAQRKAKSLGLEYRTATELAEGPLQELMSRLDLLLSMNALDNAETVAAVAGGVERPQLRMSGLVAAFEQMQATALLPMSEKQRHKWRLPKTRAVRNFIEVVGDRVLTELTRADAVKYRRWWQERVETEGIDIASANKDIGHLSKMISTIELTDQLGIKPVFSRLALPGAILRQRAAFTRAWVQDHLLATGALDGLNYQARHIVYLLASPIGLRPSEACGLDESTIHLDAPIPFIQIRANGRKLKTPHSERDIPLVGMALDIMRLNPAGFPAYRDRTDSLSAAVNKFLDQHKLLPTGDHSLYSLRHLFEDELTRVEAPDRVAATLMGHKWHRPKYGAGPSLEQKAEWLKKIILTAPAHFGPPAPSKRARAGRAPAHPGSSRLP